MTERIGSYTHLVFEGENLIGVAKDLEECNDRLFGTVLIFGSWNAIYLELCGYRTLRMSDASEDVIAEADYLLEAV